MDPLKMATEIYDKARREDRELTPAEVAEMERCMDELERRREEEHDRLTRK